MPPPGPPPSGVGSDGSVDIAGGVQLFGGLDAAGAGGVRFGSSALVLGELRSGGPVAASQFLSVGDDLFAAGDLSGRIDVDGDVHVSPDAAVPPTVNARGLVREPVSVAPPCACGAPAVDAAALAHARAASNDDGAIGLDAGALAHVADGSALDLPCGAYYVTSLGGGALELRVHGHAALFVDGDVALSGALQVTLDASAELDLVVAGGLGATAITSADPTATRLWVGGSAVHVSSGSVSGLLYAPAAVLTSDGALTAVGGLFVGGVSVAGDVDLRFDAQALAAAGSCH